MKPRFLNIPLILTLLFTLQVINAQLIVPTDTLMVLIPAGEYTMGKDSKRESNFSPAHRVKVDAFFMDRHEVTNREYIQFCKETGYKFPEFWNTDIFRSGDNFLEYPVVGVNLWDAYAYAKWAGKRLPTEAEWEYAARGGLEGKAYPNGDEWMLPKAKQDSLGWKNLIYPVESQESNAFGLYEMGGNVWEWVSDKYVYNYYERSEVDNPKGPREGDMHLIRGGSWHSGAMCKRVYFRRGLPGNWSDFAVGFRCVKNIE